MNKIQAAEARALAAPDQAGRNLTMPRHAAPLPYLRRPVPVPRWALALGAIFGVVLIGTTAVAAVTPTYNAQCVVTPKPNGGQVLDCDPIAVPSISPSASPSPSGSPTASPSPTLTTTPPSPTSPPTTTTAPPSSTPAPSPTLRDCLHNLAACGYPNAGNTGPTGTLTVSTGNLVVTTTSVIENRDIRGCVDVRAANVVIRNSRITCPDGDHGGDYVRVRSDSTNLTIVDSEIDCLGGYGVAVGTRNLTVTRTEIRNCENGGHIDGNFTVRDSWVHDLAGAPDGHFDGFQFGSGAANVVIEHSVIYNPNGQTSALIMWDESYGTQNRDVLVRNNILAGGGWTLYCGRYGTAVNVVISGNRFVPGQYGYANSCDTGGEVWSGNVRDSDGAILGAA